MKRKRWHRKGKPNKPPLVRANEAYLNVVTLNTEDNSGLDDFDTAEYDSEMEVDTPSKGTDQPDKLSNINLDELVDKTVRQLVYGRAKVGLRTSNLDYQLTSSDVPTRSDTDKSCQQLALEERGVVTEKMEDTGNSLPEMEVAISGNPSKKAGSIKIKTSRGLDSSSINQTSNAELVQGERPHQKEPNIPHQNPQYNMQELNAALAVIKKVMKMDAAEPFNVPVNPIALGIPDYFDVIDKPMDFGTICRNLESGVEYMNSEDVFKDVQYIWENCYKYNNKGDYIIELMKRVKKNFTKYWAAAGLYREQSRSNGHSHLPPPVDTTMKRSRRVPRCPVGPMNGSPSQQQQDQLDPSQPQTLQPQQPPPSCGQPYQTQLSSSLPQPSQPHTGSVGHSHLLPRTDSAMRCSRHLPRCPVGPMISSTNQHQQDHSGLNQPQPQQPPPSCSQLQPSQPQASANTGSAGHSYLLPPTDSAMRRIRRLARCPVGPMTSNPRCQQQDQSGPSKPHPQKPQQPPPSYSQPYQPQSSSSQLQTSQPQAGIDTGSADSAMRCSRHVPRCPVGPMTSNPSPQDQLGSQQPKQHTPSYSQPHQPQSSSSQLQPSQPQTGTDNGHLHLLPLTYSGLRRSRRVSRCPVGPMTSSPSQQQQDQLGPSQPQPQQPLLSYNQSYQPQTISNPPYQPQTSSNPPYQPQPSSSQLQPSQPQAGADASRAGHLHLLPPMDSAMRCSSCVPRCQVGPMANSPSQQQQDQLSPNQPQPQQAPPSYSQPYQPQQSSSQSQPSLQQSSTDTDTTDFVSTRKRTRGPTRRRTRGPTRCLSVWGRPEGERISVPTNKLGQPIGPKAPKLSNFLGTIARNGHMAPLTFVDWRGMPDAAKEKMWQLVESKFDIDPSRKTWVLMSLGKKWKDWKAELKANHYYPHKTDEERLADCDERVLPDQWPILISFWNSKEGKKRSATNRANRAHQRIRHTAGTKSFARLHEEERVKRPNGEEPTREELFILTHTRKDGKPVDEASSVAISQLRERTTQPSKTPQGSTPRDDIFSQVMGEDRRGRVLTYGLGPSPSIWGPTPSRAEALRMASEAKRLADEEVRQMRERMETMEQKYTHMETQMAKMMSAIQRRYPDEHTSDPLGTRQVPDASSTPEDSPQPQVHSSSSSHPVPSHELLYQLQKHTTKKGKKWHRSTVGVARTRR